MLNPGSYTTFDNISQLLALIALRIAQQQLTFSFGRKGVMLAEDGKIAPKGKGNGTNYERRP
jgi:hypothetical protein